MATQYLQAPHKTRWITTSRIAALAMIAGPAQFMVANIVTQLGWSTPYSWADNNISDLGNVHCAVSRDGDPRYICSPWHVVLNTSAVLDGLLLIVGVVLSAALWRQGRATKVARVFLIGGALGFITAGLSPADVDLNLHVLGAFLIMGLGNIGFLLACFARRDTLLGRLRMLTVSGAVVAFIGTLLHFSNGHAPFGVGGSERFALFALQLWFVVLGVFLVRKRGLEPA